MTWEWSALTEKAFTRIIDNHGVWHQHNSAADTPYASLHSVFYLNSRAAGQILLDIQIDGGLDGAEGLLNDFVAAINEGTGVQPTVQRSTEPWLRATLANKFDTGGFDRTKSKGAYLRKPWTAAQSATLYRYLSADSQVWGEVSLYSYGAKVNSVPETATATAQRDSIIKVWMSATWMDPTQDDANLAWIREIYRDVFATTGGVPVPGDRTEGTFINYPDIDLTDPQWNTSGVPWHTLYYKGNYPRLLPVAGIALVLEHRAGRQDDDVPDPRLPGQRRDLVGGLGHREEVHPVDALQRGGQGLRLLQVALDDLDAGRQRGGPGCPGERPHMMPRGRQAFSDMAADLARGTGQQDVQGPSSAGESVPPEVLRRAIAGRQGWRAGLEDPVSPDGSAPARAAPAGLERYTRRSRAGRGEAGVTSSARL